ncbi:hypothetical protein ACQ4PT_019512 [Festuca glaucescens]
MAEKIIAGPSGTAPAGKEDDIGDLFTHLELNEDELDDVVIRVEEAKVYQEAGRWLVIGKVLTNRTFSADALFEKMKSIWNLSRELNCREAGENLFIFQMHCLGDWKKVVHQGPWTFRGFGLLVEDYDGLSAREDFVFNGLYVWAQIHGIPELYRKMEVVDDLAHKVGKVKEVQLAPKLFFEDGVWEEKKLQFEAWMLATRRANQPALAPRRFTSRAPMRGGFSRRGGLQTGSARKHSSEDAALDTESDLGDTGTSPLKSAPMESRTEGDGTEKDTTSGASRKLDMDNSVAAIMDEIIGDSGVQSSKNIHVEIAPPPPPAYVDPRDRAKLRKTGDNQNNLATSTASDEEDRWAQ